MSYRHLLAIMFSFLPFYTLHGDLIGFPDDLISAKGEVKLELGINYSNGSLYNCSDILAGCYRTNYDALTWSPGVRYGINPKTELYTRASLLNINSTSTSLNSSILGSENSKIYSKEDRLQDLWLGINYRIWNDATTPGLLIFLEGSAMENVSLGSDTDLVYGKTWIAGTTMYRSLDPVILAATASYRYTAERGIKANNGESLNPGDSFLFNPSISFAANNEVSITSGFQWQRQIDGDQSTSRTDLTLGMGYMWSNALTFHVSTSTDMTGDGGSSISLLALYTLGKEQRVPLVSPSTPHEVNITAPQTQTTPVIPSPIITPPVATLKTAPTTIIPQTFHGQTVWLNCKRLAQGWSEETLECQPLAPKDINASKGAIGTFEQELAQGESWIQSQNPNNYTIEISIQNILSKKLLLNHLSKTRFSFSQESYLHRLNKNKLGIILGVFKSRKEAIDFLDTLPLVTHISTKSLRTFRGLSREINSLR